MRARPVGGKRVQAAIDVGVSDFETCHYLIQIHSQTRQLMA